MLPFNIELTLPLFFYLSLVIQGRNILCMSSPSWEGDYAKTIVEMMRILAQENKVLYVENPATWLDLFRLVSQRKWGQVAILLGAKPKKVEEQNSCVYVLNPGPVIPINFLPHNSLYERILKWNNHVVLRKVKRALSKLKMDNELIHINALNPMLAVHTLNHFKESTSVYYCYDEISAAHCMKDHGAILEPDLLRNADLTVVTSAGLLENKKAEAKRITLVKNGVDYSLFSQGFRKEMPQEKVIGYIGSIDNRFDLDLLAYCMDAHPEWTFEFVGRITDENTANFLRNRKNVLLRGAEASCDLPVFLPHYSVGIIPFLKNKFTRGIYPLKINEYLAAGIPVVLTDFGLLREFEDISTIAKSKEEFLAALEEQIENDSIEKRYARKDFARGNSWKARAEVFSAEIDKVEHKREAQFG